MNIFRRPSMALARSRVYADAAAATPISPRSRAELVRLLSLCGNPGALHTEGVAARAELEAARERIATAIGAHPDEIVFTASGTEANNLALEGVLRPMLLAGEQSHAIALATEHSSVLEPLRALAREGLEVTELAVGHDGVVDLEALQQALVDDTALVSVQLVNSEIGTIEPIKEIAKILRRAERKPLLHTDAAQAPLWLELNVQKLGVDLMTLDAQKVLGPKGVGCLYVRRGTDIEPILWGGRQERALRAGTENVPLAGAFAVALEDAQAGATARAAAVAQLRDALWADISKRIPDALINGPQPGGTRVANNLNISIPGLEAQMAVVSLDSLGVAVSTRSACSAGEEEPSHVIKALGVPTELSGTAIRITLLPGATMGQMRRIAEALAETAHRYRKK